ncbi:hypothetical protein IR152_15425 [Clostridioides sp. ES-S-0108-01]|uniref:DUF6056 family protein n=1 Tax=Clostridioides sp. ES-S-0108-01 TaxID=2770773 RepID=UPI001D0BFBE1|nr:hypothetical protein [Clostridioides sp. ES-S-0108-01]UDN50433.1 hypothetical protein JJC16_13855 [Clostridioides sp. ES-S-0107-01]
MQKFKLHKKEILLNCILIVFLFMITASFPYTGDDWAWGSSIGVERYNSFFYNYNGRYLGNLIVLLLTRFKFLRIISGSMIIWGIIVLTYRFSNKKNTTIFLTTCLIMLMIPRLIFREAVVWTSGFTNYAISAFTILIFIYMIKDIFDKNELFYSKQKIIFLFLLSFCNSLIVEHVTIYSILISIFVIIYSYKKFKRIYTAQIIYFIGATIGAVIMFSNSAYISILNNNDTYRQVPSGGLYEFILSAIHTYFNVIYKELFLNNVFLNLVLALLAVIIIMNKRKFISKIKNNYISNLILTIIILYAFYSLMVNINSSWQILLKYTKYFEGVFSVAYFISIGVLIKDFIEDKFRRNKILFLWISIVLLVAPLFVVKPIGSRCFFVTYVIFMLIINEILNLIMSCSNLDYKYINKFISISIAGLMIYYSSIYIYCKRKF